jgi:hypothetical protein
MRVFTCVYHIQNSVQIFDNFLPIGDDKRSSATHHANDFCGKKMLKSPGFKEKNSEIAICKQQVPVGCQRIAGFLEFLTLLSNPKFD